MKEIRNKIKAVLEDHNAKFDFSKEEDCGCIDRIIEIFLTTHIEHLEREIAGLKKKRKDNPQGSLDEGRFGFNQAIQEIIILKKKELDEVKELLEVI